MPVGLLDLPEEVLEACISELLPPLRENGPAWIMDRYPLVKTVPVHILRVRLACSLLYHLATPWVWRRLDIYLDSHTLERERPSHNHPIALHKWIPLVDQPEVAKHVRFFSLFIQQIPDYELRPALAALIPLVRMMNQLRVVQLEVVPVDYAAESKEIPSTLLADLLSKPELHTSILRCSIPPHSALRSLANVKRLSISAHWLENILPITPQLEVLSFFGPLDDDSDASSLPIPWNTLRELETHNVEDWTHILDNYTAWKERNPTEYSPLSELFIWGVSLDVDMMRRLLAVFSEQQLTRLNLWGKVYVDIAILRSLLATFPLLEDLNLITFPFDVDWETELSDISEIFGQCLVLKDFRCSCVIEVGYLIDIPNSDEEEGSIEALRRLLRSKLAEIVASLGKNTRSLNYVQFFDRYDESYSFEIERDGQGDYRTSYLAELPYDLTHRIKCLHTSGWRLKNFNDL